MMNKKTVFGWAMYDWANSAYSTTAAVAVLPAYFAGSIVPKEGVEILGRACSATTLWGIAVGAAALAVFLISPWLGAVADHTNSKKRFLMFFCLAGSLCTASFLFTRPDGVFPFLLLFVAAQISFVSANVFYDAFLPQIAPPEHLDAVSAKGFAYGYIGGGLQFLLSLLLIALHDQLGLDKNQAARLALAMTGLWWGGFAVTTFRLVPEPGGPVKRSGLFELGLTGAREAAAVFKKVWGRKRLRRFLAAYFLYNDGVQTAIFMATIYGKEELGLSDQTLMLTLLAIQFTAFFGALGFGRLGTRFGTKKALMWSIMVWTGVAVFAAFINSSTQFFALGILVGLVLGGSQALSRSMFSAMIPAGEAAAHFGFFSIVTKLSAVAGPFVFAAATQATGSSRPATLVLALFFLGGLALLSRVDFPPAGDKPETG